ncbi:hypothetical protein [Bacteroides cellulosilyticus]|jgi:hypothetical protein|uniref:hypothetical protein n=1 Tax=Bacteroides cellulosilyticus TaxID=246787 RepID=UPI001D06C7EE|nr:hypothetical protein [Bacteroides cellulosilyticus]MCB6272053.1 hypothetical protein [Bacteroides cellulosilyticus]MCG4972326.1 hypothetical protein [Bacteroides cellulosilyticus]
MVDFKQYIPDDDRSWIIEYYDRIGVQELIDYYDKVFVCLFDMGSGDELNIVEIVSPENYDLFIKCVSTCFRELASYGMCGYHLEGSIILKR